jgi:hypothetical protein
MRKFKGYLPLALLVLAAVTLAAGVNGVFNNVTANGSVNSAGGHKVAGGAGTSGYALCSNGSVYNTACPIPGAATLYYQHMNANGTPMNQRQALNFSPLFVLGDSASPDQTNVGLNKPGTGVYVASYAATVGTSTALAAFDGNGNLTPSSSTPYNCSGSYPNETCYEIEPSGKIIAEGHITVTFPSATMATGSITYPVVFTNIPRLLITANDNADGTNNFNVWSNSGSTSGSNVSVRCAVNIGGSGCAGSLSSTVPLSWVATGK